MRFGSPRWQAAALGLIFFFCFAAYDTIQVYAKRLYHGNTGTNSVLCIYITFTVGCLFASRAIAALGERTAIAIGVFCYASLVVAGLVDLVTGYADWLILLGGGLLCCGAALLWTAQGSLILAYGADERERGRVFAIFWSLYRAAPLLGGLLSLCYFSVKDDQQAGSPALFIIFLALILTGGSATALLRDPAEMRAEHAQRLSDASHAAPFLEAVDTIEDVAQVDAHEAADGVSVLVTVRHVASPTMLSLGLLFCSSGSNEACASRDHPTRAPRRIWSDLDPILTRSRPDLDHAHAARLTRLYRLDRP